MLRRYVLVALAAALGLWLVRVLSARHDHEPIVQSASWPPLRVPDPEAEPWAEPLDDGSCADSHPIKVKLSSGIFHRPGGLSYERTRADRCYCTAEDAESVGFRAALQ